MSASNSASTGSARSAKAVVGKNRKRERAWLVEAEALWRNEDPTMVRAIDAVAIALYEASWHGQIVPEPQRVVFELLRMGWVVERLPDEEE